MSTNYEQNLREARETFNKTSLSLRKVHQTAWNKVANDNDRKETSHPADMRRLASQSVRYYNEILHKANGRDLTDDEFNALACLNAVSDIMNITADQQYDLEHNFFPVDGSMPSGSKTIFGKGEKLALPFRPNNYDGIHLGHIMRGMAMGAGGISTIQNALSEGTDSAGGYTAPVEILREFVDLMRAKSQLFNAGARTVVLNAKQSNLATVATDPVAGWRAENAPVSESDLALGNVAFTPKSLAVMVKVSRELLQDSINVEEILLNSLAQGLATQLDFAGLYGSGASNQPLGLDSALTTASKVTTLAANGAKLSASGNYKPFIQAAAQVAANNDTASAVILAPRTMYDLAALADSTGQPLRQPPMVDNMQLLDTNSIPVNLTVGSGTTCSEAFVGNFTNLLLGLRQELRIEVVNQTFAGNMQIGYIAHLRADWQRSRIGSFWKVRGILAE